MSQIAYAAFLMIFTYVVFARMEPEPSWQECYVIVYIISTGCEKIREIISSEPKSISNKLSVWVSNKWNPCDVTAIIFFLIGLNMRLRTSWMDIGRIFICVDIVYWYMRILNIIAINRYLGPLVSMVGQIMKKMTYYVLLLVVMLVSFGVCRQSIMNPDNDFEWTYAKDAVFHPYYMLFGNTYAEEATPDCGEDGRDKCVTGGWISPLAETLYLMMTFILIVNMMIAMYNHIFTEINAITNEIWMFHRFAVVMEYEQMPVLPPPLIILSHIVLILKYIKRTMRGLKEPEDNAFKLFLSKESLERLNDFEKECVEGYCQEHKAKLNMSSDERIKNTAERVDNMIQKVEDIHQKHKTKIKNIQNVELRIRELEDLTLENMAVFNSFMATYTQDREFSASLAEVSGNKQRKRVNDEIDDDEPSEYREKKRHVSLGGNCPLRRRPTRSLTEFKRDCAFDEGLTFKLHDFGSRDSTKALKENSYTLLEEQEEVEKEKDDKADEGELAIGRTIQGDGDHDTNNKQAGTVSCVTNSESKKVGTVQQTRGSLELSLLDFLKRNSVNFWSQGQKSGKMRKISADMGGSVSLPHSPRRQRSETYSGPDNVTVDEESQGESDLPMTEPNLSWTESRLKLKPAVTDPQFMLSGVQSEYSSITDELETVWGLLSPPHHMFTPGGSPMTASRDRHHSEMSNPEMALYLEKEQLRDAEDNDYQLMERLIQRHYEDESTDN